MFHKELGCLNLIFYMIRCSIKRFVIADHCWRLKSPASWLFTQAFIQARIKENIKASRYWPLRGEFISNGWIPRTKGQSRGTCFHLMTSSWALSRWLLLSTQQGPDFTNMYFRTPKNRESRCQLCRGTAAGLSLWRQPALPQVTTMLASWQLLIFSECRKFEVVTVFSPGSSCLRWDLSIIAINLVVLTENTNWPPCWVQIVLWTMENSAIL